MKNSSVALLLVLASLAGCVGAKKSAAPLPLYKEASAPVEARIDDLLARMTQEEKIGQLVQDFTVLKDADLRAHVASGAIGSLIWFYENPALYNEYQRLAVEKTRLGIPILCCLDVIHGEHLVFPIAPAVSGAFEPELFEKAQSFAAREARANGIALSFAPMCDTARDPRWGRVAETCGEDPYLNALCVAAQVRGFQGKDPSAPDHVSACLKHFVGYSAVTGGRDYNDASFSEWDLRNTHLPSFRAGVAAGALTVMSSFNTIDGIPSVACHHTLTEILRGEWGFTGFVVSDWAAVAELLKWGIAADDASASALALNGGTDIDMCTTSYRKGLPVALKDGRVSAAVLDEAVRRVLRVKFRLGLFERPYVDESLAARVRKDSDGPARALAREAVQKSVVLLKNEKGVLPLAKNLKKVALIGPFGADTNELNGCWAMHGQPVMVTLADAMRAVLPPGTAFEFVKGCAVREFSEAKSLNDGTISLGSGPAVTAAEIDRAVAAAKSADVVVMALGEPAGWTGENASRHTLGLTGRQQELFDAVAKAGKPVVAVIFSGRPLALPEIWDKAAAVLYAWQPGTEGAHGIADLLVGDATPSARLSMSVPRDVSQVPCFYNHPTTGRPGSGQYRELSESEYEARFPFGYGLTYTTFSYSPVTVDGATASATVTNTGKRDGTEVVQLYIRQVACAAGWRPIRELRGFEKVTLKPGASKVVSFTLTDEVLGYTDRSGALRCDPGAYHIFIAPDSVSGKPAAYTLPLSRGR